MDTLNNISIAGEIGAVKLLSVERNKSELRGGWGV